MVLDSLTRGGKVGLLLHCVAVVFFLVGFAVPYWLSAAPENVKVHCGLWQGCFGSVCFSVHSVPIRGLTDTSWFRGVQALACLALIVIIANIVARGLFIFSKAIWLCVLSIILDGVTVFFIFLAATVFGNKTEGFRIYLIDESKYDFTSRHFGFAFNIIGGIVFIGTAVCFLADLFLRRNRGHT